ncbi:MAG: glycosyltransferase [Candidatus Chlorobium antarcticum]|jgi:glycosyltransferase involved in cell wall biosynthesis|nr:glycosyltransferase [Candidatus Chlorobium antarcticum]
MNILFMNSAREWGGTEKWTRMAAEALGESHNTILVYRKDVVGSNFTITKYRLPCLSEADLYTLWQLIRIINTEKVEAIIPTKRKDYFLAGIAGKLTGTPVILRLGADRQLRDPWQRLTYHTLTSGIIVNAEKIKKTLLQTGYIPESKIRVIYNGLDTTEIDKKTITKQEKPFPFTLTALGRLTINKGFDFLIRSFARFLHENPEADAGLVIMGEGADRTAFEELANQLGIQNRVRFPGFLQNPYPTLQASDLFVMASTNEGLSNALLEAMYLGCAPVSTYAGGVREVITNKENGYLLSHGDEARLAAILSELYRNKPTRAAIAKAAQETVIRQFSIPRMAKEIAKFCQDTTQSTENTET